MEKKADHLIALAEAVYSHHGGPDMSYCRFSEGEVYLYAHVHGGVECCACGLADLVPTIFTKGPLEDRDGALGYELFGVTGPCEECGGEGCGACMMHGTILLETPQEAIEHAREHHEAGHQFPYERVVGTLQREIAEGYWRGEKWEPPGK